LCGDSLRSIKRYPFLSRVNSARTFAVTKSSTTGFWERTLTVLARIAGPATLCLGLCVFTGWLLCSQIVVMVFPGLASMKANTALSIALTGGSLWMIQIARGGRRKWLKIAGLIFAAVVVLIAALTLGEYASGLNLRVDELIIRDRIRAAETPYPGRMAPNTAFSLLLLGLALILAESRKQAARMLSRNFARITGAFALLPLVGYIYSVASFYKLSSYTGMAIHTAAALILLSLGILLNDPDSELVNLIRSDSLGAVLERRLLPAVLLVPLIVGWIRVEGQKAGLYGTDFGVALFTTVDIVVFFLLVLWCGRAVHNADLERRDAENALRKTTQTLQSVIRTSPMPVVVLDNERLVRIWNAAAEQVFGWSEQELIGGKYPLVAEEEQEEYEKNLKKQAEGTTTSSQETIRKRKDGQKVHVRTSGAAFWDGRGKLAGWVGILEDVTEQRQLEAQFRQAQKMEALGLLAGGIAHDFNNLLGVVIGSAEFLKGRLPPADPASKYVVEIMKASDRATTLVRQLLAFTRQQVLAPHVFVPNEIVRGISSLLKRLLGENIQLDERLAPDLGRVKVDAGQLEQVIMNLAVNARDAMPQGGKLTIETQNVTVDESYARLHKGVQPGNYVMLAVSDTGIGMSAQTQSRIFEPFFSTKEKGRGTGLGLATVYGIVRQSEGHVWVYSELGRGTTFKVYFPRTEEPGEPEAEVRSAPGAVSGFETILLVEDEESLRELGAEILRQSGYQVIQAGSPREALALLERHSARIDLLLTDVIMPGMSGHALAELLKPRFPGMSVLYVSGYTDDAIARHGVLDPGVEFLQKPYTRNALTQKIRTILDGPEADIPEVAPETI
jgi:two-component system, cell cycle sensor histidine kinase and response regulator CckA